MKNYTTTNAKIASIRAFHKCVEQKAFQFFLQPFECFFLTHQKNKYIYISPVVRYSAHFHFHGSTKANTVV